MVKRHAVCNPAKLKAETERELGLSEPRIEREQSTRPLVPTAPRPPKMCWTNPPAQLTSVLRWVWAQVQSQRDSDSHSTFLSSLQDGHCVSIISSVLRLTCEGQGQKVACIPDTLDFTPCFALTLRFTLMGVVRASGPKTLVP